MPEPLHASQPLSRSGEPSRPLGAYGLLMGVYGVALLALLGRLQVDRRAHAWGMPFRDMLLLGVATHRLSRLLAKDAVTSPLRAPFTRYQAASGGGEVEEEPRGQGLQRALGELVTCSSCMAPWVAAGFTLAHAWRPRETRAVGTLLALADVSDFLQRTYGWLGAHLHRAQALAQAVEVSEGPLHEPATAH